MTKTNEASFALASDDPPDQRTPQMAAEASDGPRVLTDDELDELAAEMDDPTKWGEVVEVGPGFYRAPAIAQDLAAAISTYRAEHGLTQQQLGQMLLLHQSQIARIEAGRHTPAIETLVRIARHLDLTLTVQIDSEGASLRVVPALAAERAAG